MKNTRLILIFALAILSGLAAGYAALRYLSDRPAPIVSSGTVETVPVVVASHDLALGNVLEEGDMKVVDWPAASLPTGFASSADELLGESLISNVQANEVILATKLASEGLRGLIPLIEPGMRALSVRVDDVIGVAGFVTPGTRVDIILVKPAPGSPENISKIILQNIPALASAQTFRESETGEAIPVSVVTVLVTPEQAEKLALAAETGGRLRMALRYTLDQESVETAGQRESRLFAGVGAARPVSGAASAGPVTRESLIEIYRGGVRATIRY